MFITNELLANLIPHSYKNEADMVCGNEYKNESGMPVAI